MKKPYPIQHQIALWLQNALQRAFPLEGVFFGEAFLGRITKSLMPSHTVERGHWSCSLALQLAANGPLLGSEWATFLVAHLDAHPLIARVEVSPYGHINLFLRPEAFHAYWQRVFAQSLKKLEASKPLGEVTPENDNLAYAKLRLYHFFQDFAAQQPERYGELKTFSGDISYWLALQDEVDWRFSGMLFEAYSALENKSSRQIDRKMRRLASALHNYYNALLVLAERKPVQKLRFVLLILCFGILKADMSPSEKNG